MAKLPAAAVAEMKRFGRADMKPPKDRQQTEREYLRLHPIKRWRAPKPAPLGSAASREGTGQPTKFGTAKRVPYRRGVKRAIPGLGSMPKQGQNAHPYSELSGQRGDRPD